MMARRRTGLAEDLFEVAASLPWWAGVLMALVSYLLLHRFAATPVAAAVTPGQMGAMVAETMGRSLAAAGQYFLPLVFLAGAGASAVGRRKRRALINEAAEADAARVVDRMRWREFEMLVGESFRREGYRVREQGGNGADGGVDLVLWRGNEKFLVQCKHWKAYRVGVEVVRELYGVMAASGATGGFVVTSGRFSADAVEFASGRNVELIDGARLQERLKRVEAAGGGMGRAGAGRDTPAAPPATPAAAEAAPECPVCARTMIKRTAMRGANAGSEFWGCTAYPGCRGTRRID